jgi:hypothetical protein
MVRAKCKLERGDQFIVPFVSISLDQQKILPAEANTL